MNQLILRVKVVALLAGTLMLGGCGKSAESSDAPSEVRPTSALPAIDVAAVVATPTAAETPLLVAPGPNDAPQEVCASEAVQLMARKLMVGDAIPPGFRNRIDPKSSVSLTRVESAIPVRFDRDIKKTVCAAKFVINASGGIDCDMANGVEYLFARAPDALIAVLSRFEGPVGDRKFSFAFNFSSQPAPKGDAYITVSDFTEIDQTMLIAILKEAKAKADKPVIAQTALATPVLEESASAGAVAEAEFHIADTGLNDQYRQSLARLDVDGRAHFQGAQREWVKQRDIACEDDGTHGQGPDSAGHIEFLGCMTQMTEARANEVRAIN